MLNFLFRQVVHGSESRLLPWRDSSSDSPSHLLFHPSNCTSNFWMESVILLGKYVNGGKESCKKTQNTHKCTLLWQKKARCESCWAWIMQEDCVLPTKHINIFLVCFRECVRFTAVKSFRLRVKEKGNAEWEKRKGFPLKTPCHAQLCSGRYHGNHALSLSAGVIVLWFLCSGQEAPWLREVLSHRQWRICAAIALLSCWGFGFQCLLRGSDELLKSREERSQTEGGEDVTAAACCVYTTLVIFRARNQPVMRDRARSSTCNKLSPANNTIIVLWHTVITQLVWCCHREVSETQANNVLQITCIYSIWILKQKKSCLSYKILLEIIQRVIQPSCCSCTSVFTYF